MKQRLATAVLALGSGLALLAASAVLILYVTNDMRWFLLVGALWLFGSGLWLGGRRHGGPFSFLLLCLPLTVLYVSEVLPQLPELWPHLLIWIGLAGLGWWGSRAGKRAPPGVLVAVLAITLPAVWYAFAYVPGAISRSLNRELNEPAPAFVFEIPDGGSLSKEDLAGKVVVLDFFATWCFPCIMELPEIDAIHRRFEGDPDVQVLVVANLSNHDTRGKVRAFLGRRNLAVPFVYDPDAVAHEAFGFAGLPGLILMDPAGNVRFQREGYNAAEGDFQESVVRLVEDLRAR